MADQSDFEVTFTKTDLNDLATTVAQSTLESSRQSMALMLESYADLIPLSIKSPTIKPEILQSVLHAVSTKMRQDAKDIRNSTFGP